MMAKRKPVLTKKEEKLLFLNGRGVSVSAPKPAKHRWDWDPLVGSSPPPDFRLRDRSGRCRHCGLQVRRLAASSGQSYRQIEAFYCLTKRWEPVRYDPGKGGECYREKMEWPVIPLEVEVTQGPQKTVEVEVPPSTPKPPADRFASGYVVMVTAEEQTAAKVALKEAQDARLKAEARVKDLELLSADLNSTVIALRGYRDGLEVSLRQAVAQLEKPQRKKLPEERPAIVHKFDLVGHHGFLTVGFYPDSGRVGEIFVEMSRDGSTVGGLLKSWGRAVSTSLQYGAPIEDVVHKFEGTNFEPSGFTGHPGVNRASSLVDYCIKWLSWRLEIDQEHGQQLGFSFEGWVKVDRTSGWGIVEAKAAWLADHKAKVAAARGEGVVAKEEATMGPVEANASWLEAHQKRVAAAREATKGSYVSSPSVARSKKDIAILAKAQAKLDKAMRFMESLPTNKTLVTGPPCPECGNMTRRSGSCYVCTCGATTGCS
jgi:hypothetical protein